MKKAQAKLVELKSHARVDPLDLREPLHHVQKALQELKAAKEAR